METMSKSSPDCVEQSDAEAARRAADALVEARFWDDVKMGSDSECWPWIGTRGTKTPSGHIRIWHRGRQEYAHRVAFQLRGGVLSDGDVCRHYVCDRPDCMNIHHLRAGTVQDNVADRERRNRRTPFLPRGGAHWSAKLSDTDAMRVRTARALGLPAQHIAAMFGISRSTVYAVWSGASYNVTTASDVNAAR